MGFTPRRCVSPRRWLFGNATRHRRFLSCQEDAEAHKAEKEILALNEAKNLVILGARRTSSSVLLVKWLAPFGTDLCVAVRAT